MKMAKKGGVGKPGGGGVQRFLTRLLSLIQCVVGVHKWKLFQ